MVNYSAILEYEFSKGELCSFLDNTGGPLLTRVLIARFLITRVFKRFLKNSVNTIFYPIPLLARYIGRYVAYWVSNFKLPTRV